MFMTSTTAATNVTNVWSVSTIINAAARWAFGRGARGSREHDPYRLSRVADITGLDVLSDGDVQVSVQLALLILRLEGRAASWPAVT